ncbi:Hypothetical protein NTJ_16219 [Nesidiocoris tenuis]|uniref:Secreted protein n=1 Tax=Nesidiocoris tenuis TaxID=355587 RepID=A0ABN7BGC7_9HEMI|nr:Hypothetical protein NTJ_16219 [Nesidiocoris tenuis]
MGALQIIAGSALPVTTGQLVSLLLAPALLSLDSRSCGLWCSLMALDCLSTYHLQTTSCCLLLFTTPSIVFPDMKIFLFCPGNNLRCPFKGRVYFIRNNRFCFSPAELLK